MVRVLSAMKHPTLYFIFLFFSFFLKSRYKIRHLTMQVYRTGQTTWTFYHRQKKKKKKKKDNSKTQQTAPPNIASTGPLRPYPPFPISLEPLRFWLWRFTRFQELEARIRESGGEPVKLQLEKERELVRSVLTSQNVVTKNIYLSIGGVVALGFWRVNLVICHITIR